MRSAVRRAHRQLPLPIPLLIAGLLIGGGLALQLLVNAARPPADRMANYDFRDCAEARAVFAAPLKRGEPWYREELDRDGDGLACELYSGNRIRYTLAAAIHTLDGWFDREAQ